MTAADPAGGFGVYIHIPFCGRRCDYCSFATWTDRHHLQDSYLLRLRADAADAALTMPPVTSVFVGGGTPSLVPAAALLEVIAELPLARGCEVTVECNPDDVTPGLLDAYLGGGVTRVSFGVQSMVDRVLASLGRTHRCDAVGRAVAAARSVGVPTFNLDIIYGAAGETLDDWRSTLEGVLDLDPPHVSAYALTIEAGTPLASQPDRHPDDDDQAGKYELADELLGAAGMAWYEISNWSRPLHECAHNRLTWAQGNYLGLGCAAHSHHGGRRWWNVRTPERWLDRRARGESPEAGHEDLDGPTRCLEALELGLRTSAGVPLSALDPSADPELADLVRRDGDRWVLTLRGRQLANEVAIRLRSDERVST